METSPLIWDPGPLGLLYGYIQSLNIKCIESEFHIAVQYKRILLTLIQRCVCKLEKAYKFPLRVTTGLNWVFFNRVSQCRMIAKVLYIKNKASAVTAYTPFNLAVVYSAVYIN